MIDPLQRWREHGEKPDYAGPLSFGSAPYTQDPALLAGFDVAIVGAPTDDLVSDRPGTRFAPRAIRAASCPSGPHLETKVDAFAALRIVDYGDAPVLPADPARSAVAIERTVGEVLDAGLIPIVLGGDHSIAEPDIAACAARHGPVGLVHFDTHTDTGTEVFGVEVSHGTPMYRLVRSGAVDPTRYVQIGIRGYWPGEREFTWQAEQGITSIFMHEVRDEGIDAAVERAVGAVGAGPVFLSVDVDVLDPAFAPGTGTPEPGGMTSADLLKAVRVVAERLELVGADVVEVIPTAVGSADITALVAERIVREILTGIAIRRAGPALGQRLGQRDAVRAAAAAGEVGRGDTDDLPIGEDRLHLREPFRIGGQAGERDDHAAVADVEVQVRQRDAASRPLAVGEDVELDHLEPGDLEHHAICLQPGVVRIVAVADRLAEDAIGGDERRHVVDVAAGAILEQAVLQPDRALDAEKIAERGLALHARDAGIPPLVEDRGLRRDQRALAVRADGASFEHDRGRDPVEPEPLGQARPDRLPVRRGRERLAPAVEEEVDADELVPPAGEDRAGVA